MFVNPEKFNIRVYALFVTNENRVLLSDEYRNGYRMTKFPGGGLEFGEGIRDALHREWDEEVGGNILDEQLFYVNEFLQVSAFNPKDQLISLYYLVRPDSIPDFPVNIEAQFSQAPKGDLLSFRYYDISKLEENMLTFPVDKKIPYLLKERFLI